jgi:RNA polymerase sigma-70 factor (ECF subfamily)
MQLGPQNILEAKYEQMFKTYFASLCYFAAKYISDRDTCKEIVHKVYISIWENRNNFDFEKSPKSYLHTAVYNRCMNFLRDNKKTESTDNDSILNIPEDYNDNIQAAELEAKIWETIDKLPEKCKEVFILNRFEEKKYAEIAIQLDISIKTVETHISKALKVLREHLKDYIHLFIFLILKWF